MRPPESLSASAISLYLTCSLKYRFQYVDKLPRLTVSENQAFGVAMHAALNWLHKARKRGHNPPLAEVLQVFEADWYAQTQAEGSQHLLQGSSVRSEHQPESKSNHADAGQTRGFGGGFPILHQLGEEPATGRALLDQEFFPPVPEVADG